MKSCVLLSQCYIIFRTTPDRLVVMDEGSTFDPEKLWEDIVSIAKENKIIANPRSHDEMAMHEATKQARIRTTSKLVANTLLAETETVPVVVPPHALFYGEMIVCAIAYCKSQHLVELMKHFAVTYHGKNDEFYAVAMLLGSSMPCTEVCNYDIWCYAMFTCECRMIFSHSRLPRFVVFFFAVCS